MNQIGCFEDFEQEFLNFKHKTHSCFTESNKSKLKTRVEASKAEAEFISKK